MKIDGTNLSQYAPRYLQARLDQQELASELGDKEQERDRAAGRLRAIEEECQALRDRLNEPVEIIQAFQAFFNGAALDQLDSVARTFPGASSVQPQPFSSHREELDLSNITYNVRFPDGTQQPLVEVLVDMTKEFFNPSLVVTSKELAAKIVEFGWTTDSHNAAEPLTATMSNVQSTLARSEGLFVSVRSEDGSRTLNRSKMYRLDLAKEAILVRYGRKSQSSPRRRAGEPPPTPAPVKDDDDIFADVRHPTSEGNGLYVNKHHGGAP